MAQIFQIPYIEFKQNKQNYLVAVMPFHCIDLFSEVLVYGKSKLGYQRNPEERHYFKIRDYIRDHARDFILPTSIILGLDQDDFTLIKKKISGTNVLELNSGKQGKIFRIVDGQHRIYGLREAAKANHSLDEFPLAIVIVLTVKTKRSTELTIFSDINSKSKRVKVDLIKLAEYDYRLNEKNIQEASIIDHICIKTAFNLKEDREASVWHNAIKFDIHNELIIGIIGVNLFGESIEGLVKTFLKTNPVDLTRDHAIILKYVNNAGDVLSKLLFSCWDDHVKNKWPVAFNSKQIEMDVDEELKTFFYKKDFYIQKTMGVKAINGIIGDLFKLANGSSAKTTADFKSRISKSKVTNEDWRAGGNFAGFSSESGVKKVKDLI